MTTLIVLDIGNNGNINNIIFNIKYIRYPYYWILLFLTLLMNVIGINNI